MLVTSEPHCFTNRDVWPSGRCGHVQ